MFWDDLFAKQKFVVGLSPMDGVTDAPMRFMCAKYSGDDLGVMFTEFVSVDALAHIHEPHKVEQVMKALLRAREESFRCPYEVAQVFGHNPELFYSAAVLVATLGFDGIDINMGCPAHNVEDLGSGAGLIRTPDVAQAIVRATKKGIQDWATGKVSVSDLDYSVEVKSWVEKHTRVSPLQIIPVSVKTRIGVDKNQVAEWIPAIMEVSPAVLTLHGRTLVQLYQGKADWNAIGEAARVVHQMGGKILGNGDVLSRIEAQEKILQYGVDGVLIGRAAEGNPLFAKTIKSKPSKEQRLAWILEHALVYQQLFVETSEPEYMERAFIPLRKHLAWYATGFAGASQLRQRLVQCKNIEEVEASFRD